MWRDRRILDLLGIEHPIILAPMASVGTPELVAAVSEAGGLGIFGAASTRPDRLRNTVQAIRQRTNRPFSMNLFASHIEDYDRDAKPGPRVAEQLAAYHAELGLGPVPDQGYMFGPIAEQFEVLVEQDVPVVSFHFGADARHPQSLHRRDRGAG